MVIFMNKKGLMILAIIISILIIGGVGYYFYNQFQSNKKDKFLTIANDKDKFNNLYHLVSEYVKKKNKKNKRGESPSFLL